MNLVLKKTFHFSACFTQDGRVCAANYLLDLKIPYSDASSEHRLVDIVEKNLIEKIHTRDLGQVDFLAKEKLSDGVLARALWRRLTEILKPIPLYGLVLHRDDDAAFEISVGEGS